MEVMHVTRDHEPVAPPKDPLRDGDLVVRLPEDDDVDSLVAFGNDQDVAETIWVPIPHPCPRPVAEQRLNEFRRGWEAPSHFGPTFIVADAATNQMIGVVFLSKRDEKTVGLPYGVAPEWRGRGIGTRAMRLVSRWCIDEAGFDRVELRIDLKNHASQRVAENSGFRRSGIGKSHVPGTGKTYDDALYVLERAGSGSALEHVVDAGPHPPT